jgi:hypothetical protein
MAQRSGQQGTGKHGHKDTQEPYPHTKDNEGGQAQKASGGQGRNDDGGSRSGGRQDSDGGSDLKAREYRDDQGNVHHHTKTYMEQHGGKGGNDR